MKHILVRLGFALIAFYASAALSSECWRVSNIRGQSAFSDDGYKFASDKIRNRLIICFEGKVGTVTGTDTPLSQFGVSTLAGTVTRNKLELFEVYQLDRANRKMLHTKSRVGTKSRFPQVPDVVSAFVGDAVQMQTR